MELLKPPENPNPSGLCSISRVKGAAACASEAGSLAWRRWVLVVELFEKWCIAEGLLIDICICILLVVVVAVGAATVAVSGNGGGRRLRWPPLPRAAGTSWLCFPS